MRFLLTTQPKASTLISINLISKILFEYESQIQEAQKAEFQEGRSQSQRTTIGQFQEILKFRRSQHRLSQSDLPQENQLKIFQARFIIITIVWTLIQEMK